jgi:hypothetical protein
MRELGGAYTEQLELVKDDERGLRFGDLDCEPPSMTSMLD